MYPIFYIFTVRSTHDPHTHRVVSHFFYVLRSHLQDSYTSAHNHIIFTFFTCSYFTSMFLNDVATQFAESRIVPQLDFAFQKNSHGILIFIADVLENLVWKYDKPSSRNVCYSALRSKSTSEQPQTPEHYNIF